MTDAERIRYLEVTVMDLQHEVARLSKCMANAAEALLGTAQRKANSDSEAGLQWLKETKP